MQLIFNEFMKRRPQLLFSFVAAFGTGCSIMDKAKPHEWVRQDDMRVSGIVAGRVD